MVARLSCPIASCTTPQLGLALDVLGGEGVAQRVHRRAFDAHDRYLLDRVSKEILALDGKGGSNYFAELSQWEDWKEQSKKAPAPQRRHVAPAGELQPVLTPKEAKELQKMEASIHAAEAKAFRVPINP